MPNKKRFSEDNHRFYRGRGHGRGKGHGRRGRGRPAVIYPIDLDREVVGDKGVIELSSFEMQILKMADIESLKQNEIAEKLNISQTSVWRYLRDIRKRLAEAISNHNEIIIKISD